jgi:hypothetical protein
MMRHHARELRHGLGAVARQVRHLAVDDELQDRLRHAGGFIGELGRDARVGLVSEERRVAGEHAAMDRRCGADLTDVFAHGGEPAFPGSNRSAASSRGAGAASRPTPDGSRCVEPGRVAVSTPADSGAGAVAAS